MDSPDQSSSAEPIDEGDLLVAENLDSQIQAIQRQILDGHSLSPAEAHNHGLGSPDLVQGEVMESIPPEHQRIVAEIMQAEGAASLLKSSYYTSSAVPSRAAVSSYIPTGSNDDRQFDVTEEDLLNHSDLFAGHTDSQTDINDEDRRIVALVAVQIANQHKQEQAASDAITVDTTMGNNVPLSKQQYLMQRLNSCTPVSVPNTIYSTGNGISSTLRVQTPDIEPLNILVNQPSSPAKIEPLSPLKKVLASHSTRSLRVPTKPKYVEVPLDELDEAIKDEPDDLDLLESESDKDVDSDAVLPEEESEDESDLESDVRSSRRLPHKKRIPRKLKQPKKTRIPTKCYKCNKCDEQLPNQQAYNDHKLCHARKLFTCEICKKGFAQQLRFFEHLKAHYEAGMEIDGGSEMLQNAVNLASEPVSPDTKSAKPSLKCEKCNRSFRREKAYEAHMMSMHQEPEPIEEPVLEKPRRVGRPKKLVQPKVEPKLEEEVQEAEVYADPLDLGGEDVAPEVEDVDDVVVPEEEIDDNVCELCKDEFPTKAKLNAHMRKAHNETRKRKKSPSSKKEILTCPKCGRVFNHRNSLVYHLRSHTGERPHQCEMCGKSFFASSALKVHMRLHSGEKPYKCEYCGRHFRQWGDLKYHCISIHTDERQYQCEFCGKDFARKYSLIVHRRIHTGERNYKCEFCGKCFRAASYLQNHRRIHTGEKPHPCGICGKPFRVRSDMKRHMQTHSRETGQQGMSHDRRMAAAMAATAVANTTHVTLTQATHELVTDSQITMDESADAIITDSLGQPVSLSITVPQRTLEGHAGTAQQLTQGVQEEVLAYTREQGMESVTLRESNSGTVFVWPVYMN